MDRPDETRERKGDVLGLGSAAGSEPDAPHTSEDPEEKRKRRARMREDTDQVTTGTNDLLRGSGAASTDMGSAGEGTDIER
jgi:hypothetical protein